MKAVEHIKKIFNDFKLEDLFHEYENDCYERILKLIDENCVSLPKGMFMVLVQKIFKRNK